MKSQTDICNSRFYSSFDYNLYFQFLFRLIILFNFQGKCEGNFYLFTRSYHVRM